MARHLTWCFKRAFTLTNRLNVVHQPIAILKASDYAAYKLPMDTDIPEPRDLGQFNDDNRSSGKIATTALMKMLCITHKNASTALAEYPVFRTLPRKIIFTNFQILRESGVFKSTIKDHKFLLTIPEEELKQKIALLKAVNVNVNDGVHLFQLGVMVLKNFENKTRIDTSYFPNGNRLHYLAEKLECGMSKLCYAASYHPRILDLPAPKILTFTEYLLENGIKPEYILKDFAVYSYSLEKVKVNLQRAKSLNIYPLKPWIIRATRKSWEKAEKDAFFIQKTDGTDMSREEFIADIFKCDIELAKYLLTRDPRIARMKLRKLSIMASMVVNAGYTVHDVIIAPLFMQYNPTRMHQRMNEWFAAGLPRARPFVFALPEYQFREKMNKALQELKQRSESSDVGT